MVFTTGVVDAVVDGEGSHGTLQFVGLDVIEVCYRSRVGAPVADPHGVRS